MRNVSHAAVAAFVVTACLSFSPLVQAAGGGSMSTPSMPSAERERTPEELARDSYNDGVRLIRKADKADPASDRASGYYRDSLGKFEAAVAQAPGMYQAWNYIGYAKRHLGDYAGALSAYDQALSLKADYAEAIEYRGHAYLGLNRLDDAKNAYLALFAANRKLANQLLTGMQAYVSAHRADAKGVDAAALDGFASWVDERARIAGQTTALTREGAGSSWH